MNQCESKRWNICRRVSISSCPWLTAYCPQYIVHVLPPEQRKAVWDLEKVSIRQCNTDCSSILFNSIRKKVHFHFYLPWIGTMTTNCALLTRDRNRERWRQSAGVSRTRYTMFPTLRPAGDIEDDFNCFCNSSTSCWKHRWEHAVWIIIET